MSIRQVENKFKWLVSDDRIFFIALLVLMSCAAYGLGRLSVTGMPVVFTTKSSAELVVHISSDTVLDDRLTIDPAEVTSATVIGSRNGTRYYSPNCSGVGRISEENRLYFIDRHRAQAAGYTASVQCFD